MLIIYCIGLFDGCFGFGVWQCWNCRVPFFLLGWRGTPEGGGIGEVDVVEGRQRKVASLRAGTPSGDTTRAP